MCVVRARDAYQGLKGLKIHCVESHKCVHRHTYTNDYSCLGSCLPDPKKQSTHGASVLFHILVGEWTLMQPSRLQKRKKNDSLSVNNTVTLKMSLH